MNTALLIQQVYPGMGYETMIELTRERNKEYCKKHGVDYQCLIGTSDPRYADYREGGWVKVELIHKALFKNYRYIVWLDADALIKDMDTDLRDGCIDGVGACWMRVPQPSGMYNHWNVGVLYVQNSQAAKNFISSWLAEYPGPKKGFMEQQVFNDLAMKSKVVQTISDRWNSTLNYTMVPDAVVLGYHGAGNAQQRFDLMKSTLDTLQEKTEKVLDIAEVNS